MPGSRFFINLFHFVAFQTNIFYQQRSERKKLHSHTQAKINKEMRAMNQYENWWKHNEVAAEAS